jgi:hypothetical protein
MVYKRSIRVLWWRRKKFENLYGGVDLPLRPGLAQLGTRVQSMDTEVSMSNLVA